MATCNETNIILWKNVESLISEKLILKSPTRKLSRPKNIYKAVGVFLVHSTNQEGIHRSEDSVMIHEV